MIPTCRYYEYDRRRGAHIFHVSPLDSRQTQTADKDRRHHTGQRRDTDAIKQTKLGRHSTLHDLRTSRQKD